MANTVHKTYCIRWMNIFLTITRAGGHNSGFMFRPCSTYGIFIEFISLTISYCWKGFVFCVSQFSYTCNAAVIRILFTLLAYEARMCVSKCITFWYSFTNRRVSVTRVTWKFYTETPRASPCTCVSCLQIPDSFTDSGRMCALSPEILCFHQNSRCVKWKSEMHSWSLTIQRIILKITLSPH
jgi:hypothetical protein